jgi:hypothetical protein
MNVDSQRIDILRMHESTVRTLNKTERFFLDIFVKEGSAVIVPDEETP